MFSALQTVIFARARPVVATRVHWLSKPIKLVLECAVAAVRDAARTLRRSAIAGFDRSSYVAGVSRASVRPRAGCLDDLRVFFDFAREVGSHFRR